MEQIFRVGHVGCKMETREILIETIRLALHEPISRILKGSNIYCDASADYSFASWESGLNEVNNDDLTLMKEIPAFGKYAVTDLCFEATLIHYLLTPSWALA
jgi:hypothetical protein